MTAFTSKFFGLTLIAATIAAVAATTSAGIGWPVWAMFIGWVAFFTGEHSVKGALRSYLCVAIGIAFGTIAAMSVGTLMPFIDYFAFGVVVFLVAIVVVSLRAAPLLNNIPAYFLGLIAFFAAHVPPSLLAFGELAAVSGLGAFAALVAHRLQTKAA
ncbi:hypothetical protein A8A54_19330 [Brucella pseudogrignonensis]|uniref:DUF1097 domain-containing protein n=1 Tax=Brucella pseudogrignonensis TaxID=419475 RepID=UPI0007DA66D1|nr:DUF1097 domain-containing protein [Brucella pseudogrignonensis]ANG98755.1 hypothetical protein A8A54_19330 [Brucella pseudogrignonensis]